MVGSSFGPMVASLNPAPNDQRELRVEGSDGRSESGGLRVLSGNKYLSFKFLAMTIASRLLKHSCSKFRDGDYIGGWSAPHILQGYLAHKKQPPSVGPP